MNESTSSRIPSRIPRRSGLLLILFLVLSANLSARLTALAAGVYVDPVLRSQMTVLGLFDKLQAVVNFNPTLTSGVQLAGAIQDLGAGTVTFNNLDSVAVLASAAQINAITGLPGVTEVYANRQLKYFMAQPNAFIGADAVWNSLGITGAGIGVAILDSGIDGTHPDLAFGSKTVQNVKIVFNETDVFSTKGKPATKSFFIEELADTDTTSGHGTHCAGIAAGNGAASGGQYQGVARDATLLGIGTGDTLVILWALAGFDYLLDHAQQFNIKVVNNSWGTEGGAQGWDPKDPINKATKKVHDRGITVVFAAGNSGPDPDTMNPYAEAPWVIGVAAGCFPQDTAHCPDGLLTDFSSRGVPGSAQFHPTLTAPGSHIVSTRALTGTTLNVLDANHDLIQCDLLLSGGPETFANYTCASGTSMAAPHVAGTVALMQQAAGGELTPDQVKRVLETTARVMTKNDGTPFGIWEAGAGYLDAFAAVLAVLR
ncbi:MAG: S8 family serine peptidase [Verrucomicrobia bacterium]|nr:S8 family serine peptidase [Verrucomicrobiota bacterium]